MTEIKQNEQRTPLRLNAITEEFDFQKESADPFRIMSDVFGGYKNGPLILALGRVGGNGASSKAMGILEQLASDNVPFQVVAMKKYLADNPLIADYLKKNSISPSVIDDSSVDTLPQLYKRCEEVVIQITNEGSVSGILSLGPRTFYPETARRVGIPAMIIDGAVPDTWSNTVDVESGYPDTAYSQKAYEYATYTTTCGFTGWAPPKNTYPEGMDLRVVQQPFSDQKIGYLRELRNIQPSEARSKLLRKGTIRGLDENSLIVVPTMDQVYVNPEALASRGGFMTQEQFGQAYSFMAETIAVAAQIGVETGERISVYIRPGVIATMMQPILSQYAEYISILAPTNGIVANEDWLLLRKAGVTIGRAPLCVSTAEALGMNDLQVTAAVPGSTTDGVSYMTEAEGLRALNRKGVSRIYFPGDSLRDAINEVRKIKGI